MFRATQIGVVHAAKDVFPKCANKEEPGQYMRVTHFKKWIMKQTDDTAQDSNC